MKKFYIVVVVGNIAIVNKSKSLYCDVKYFVDKKWEVEAKWVLHLIQRKLEK